MTFNKCYRPELRWPTDRSKNITASRSMEAFHYVSYIPYNGYLFELDGLKPHPIDHGELVSYINVCMHYFGISF